MRKNTPTYRQTDRQIDRQIERQVGRNVGRWTDRQTDRHVDRKVGRWTDRQTDIAKLTIIFRSFTNAPKTRSHVSLSVNIRYTSHVENICE